VIYFKWGIIFSIVAILISVVLGMISGVRGLHIFLRAILFAPLFFGIGFGLRFIINIFLPELLTINESAASSETNETTEHVSIAMDSRGEYAVPELFSNQGDSQELGNIDDLISGVFKPGGEKNQYKPENGQSGFQGIDFSMSGDEGIDQNKETGYNDFGAIGGDPFNDNAAAEPGNFNEPSSVEKQAAFQPQFTPSMGDDTELGGLPDLDMMAMAFSSNFSSVPDAAPSAPSMGPVNSVEEPEPDRSHHKGNKPQALKGDFDPKSLAEGIRTVLSKD